jgi:hypothetical protein
MNNQKDLVCSCNNLNIEEKLNKINERIKNERCDKIELLLTDEYLLDEYKSLPSVKKKINELQDVLEREKLSNNVITNIINNYMLNLVPPGTKGVIKGNKFNKEIKNYLLSLKLIEDKNRFNIEFEKKHNLYETSEIPDWYVYDKDKNKIIIGMNQLDLWGGGHQLNRGYKYLINNIHNTENSKLLCVICNDYIIKKETNKVFSLFNIGFENNTLCYIKGLERIIKDYFSLK